MIKKLQQSRLKSLRIGMIINPELENLHLGRDENSRFSLENRSHERFFYAFW